VVHELPFSVHGDGLAERVHQVGVAAANLTLSQDRAAAVKAYLVTTFGIATDRLTTAGFGDTRPAGDNTTDAGRAENRRVELVKK